MSHLHISLSSLVTASFPLTLLWLKIDLLVIKSGCNSYTQSSKKDTKRDC